MLVYAAPLYAASNGGALASRRDRDDVTQDYIRSMRLLQNTSRGVGDLVLVYKRVTTLAGHTSRVAELLEAVGRLASGDALDTARDLYLRNVSSSAQLASQAGGKLAGLGSNPSNPALAMAKSLSGSVPLDELGVPRPRRLRAPRGAEPPSLAPSPRRGPHRTQRPQSRKEKRKKKGTKKKKKNLLLLLLLSPSGRCRGLRPKPRRRPPRRLRPRLRCACPLRWGTKSHARGRRRRRAAAACAFSLAFAFASAEEKEEEQTEEEEELDEEEEEEQGRQRRREREKKKRATLPRRRRRRRRPPRSRASPSSRGASPAAPSFP